MIQIETFIYCDVAEDNLLESKRRIDSYLENFNKEKYKNVSKTLPKNIFPVLINQDTWPFKDNSLNGIINNLSLHCVEDLEVHLGKLNSSLISDGFILANAFASQTLNELKFVLNLAENEREGGTSPNTLNFPSMTDIGNLFHKLNFTLPSMSSYNYIFQFDDLVSLCEYIELIGEANALKNKRPFKRKDTFISAISLYQNLFNQNHLNNNEKVDFRSKIVDLRKSKKNDLIYASFEICSFICWKYHPSQPKPKERGSGEFSLKELANEAIDSDANDVRYGTLKPKDNSNDEYEIIEMTELIKNKIRKKLGDEVLNEKLNKNK